MTQTPEEKGKALAEKYYNDATYLTWDEAKHCAIICVDSHIQEYEMLNERPEAINRFVQRPEYWQAVRTAIEKL
jgi:hypothetical protein